MKITVCSILVSVVLLGGRAAQGQVPELARYFPPDAIVFAQIDDFEKWLDKYKESELLQRYLKTKNYADFQKSKLYRKLNLRFKEIEKLSGFGINMDNVRSVAGEKSAFALYNIGELQFVYVTQIPTTRFIQSKLYNLRQKFEERKLKGESYFVKEKPEGGLAFAFAQIGNRLIVSNNVQLFEKSLACFKNSTAPSLAGEPGFSGLFGKDFKFHNFLLYLEQAVLNENRYFTTYWIFKNYQALKWIDKALIHVEYRKEKICEKRIFALTKEPEKLQLLKTPVNRDLKVLQQFVPENVDYFNLESIRDYHYGVSIIKEELFGVNEKSAKVRESIAESELFAVVEKLLESTQPIGEATVIQREFDENNFFLKLNKAVIFQMAKAGYLDLDLLKKALLDYYQSKCLVTKKLKLKCERLVTKSKETIYFIELPLFEKQTISFSKVDNVLVLANGADFCFKLVEDSPGRKKRSMEKLAKFTFINFKNLSANYSRLLNILSGRSNWRDPSDALFFRDNVGSIVNMASDVKQIIITGKIEDNHLVETVIYKLKE